MTKKDIFKENRERFAKMMKNSSLAIFFSKEEVIKGDTVHFNFCDTNIFYLTGIEQENIKLLIQKNPKGDVKEYIFTTKTSDFIKIWQGEKLTRKEIEEISKIENIYYNDEFEDLFKEIIDKPKTIYYYFEDKKHTKALSEYEQFIRKIKRKYKKEYINSKPILETLRTVKNKEEIQNIEKAIKITKKGLEHVMKNIKSYKNEKIIEADLTYAYNKEFSKHAYQPIVASAKNACILHYIKNNEQIKKNSLVLIDTGAEYNNYKADISRTLPSSGKFTKRQKEIYQACLEINKYMISQLKPDMTYKELQRKAYEYSAQKLIELKIINKKDYKEDHKVAGKYLLHSIGHNLGLDTHDLSNNNHKNIIKENQILTIEPGIYLEEESIGVRIEDNILITKNGSKNLSRSIPKEIEDIENLCSSK